MSFGTFSNTSAIARGAGAVLALLAAAIALAGSEDEIARCARIASAMDRIVCLEDALRRADEANTPDPADASGDRASPSAAETGTADESAPAAAGESTAALPDAREAAELSPGKPRKQAEAPESIRVTIVAIEKAPYRKARYIAGDGQVWQQTDQRTPRYPDVPFEAEIRSAAAGSFFLQPLSSDVAVRVQRKR